MDVTLLALTLGTFFLTASCWFAYQLLAHSGRPVRRLNAFEQAFDASLANSVSPAISRREAFWRLGSGIGGGILASLGLTERRPDDCVAHCCVIHCTSQLRGHDREVCIEQCQRGEGLLAAVCGELCSESEHES